MADESCRIVFKGNLNKFSEEIDHAINMWLEESAGELEAQVKELSRVDTGQTKASYTHAVDEARKEARVGSNLQNAIWEEYGTGEYALNGNGRKGGWVYKDRDGKYRHTYGKTPNRPIFRAFQNAGPRIAKRLHRILSDVEIADDT